MPRKYFNPHVVTPQERRVFVLSGDRKVKAVAIRRRQKTSKTKYQPLIAFLEGKKPIRDVKSTWPQYYERDKREFVIGV